MEGDSFENAHIPVGDFDSFDNPFDDIGDISGIHDGSKAAYKNFLDVPGEDDFDPQTEDFEQNDGPIEE